MIAGRFFVFALSVLIASRGWSAPPKVTSLFPAGAARGQTTTVKAQGEFPNWPVEVWADRPTVKVEAAKEKGKFSVIVSDDAEPGLCCLRFYTSQGATSLTPFIV